MAASTNPNRNYHVFLSFKGADVRNNFLSHLYAALDQKGIHTFVDREELQKGEEISPALMRAIEESHVAIIIFSQDYASSPWCLEEVTKIMECKEGKGLIVFPVFYKVEPREVRGVRESYGRAMAKHEFKLGKDSEKVKRWKKALFDAGSLYGWDLNGRDEAELIQCIVKKLSSHLNHIPLHVAKYPVGIDSRVQELICLSQKESAEDDVMMIGLWGPGGIGKTTIAKALYNAIERQFQGCSFLAQVRETSNQTDGLVALQKKLLSEILSHRDLIIYSVDGGISLIRERLCSKKVLLVLDDVDQLDQLNALAREGNWFGKGSRIIVTSRDKHLLTSHGINCVYEVEALEDNEALDLFGRHAFPNSKKVEIRRDLIDRALHYADGFPLALEVLGSFLRGRKETAWESTMLKLSKIPEPTINRVLKISFDALEDNEREIFLDIACFFKGRSIEYIKEVLDSRDFYTTIGIEILIERSLIKNEYGTLQMHDLIQLMGKDIVNQECPDDPGKRSRLWLFEDVRDILCEDMGTKAIKAILLDLSTPEEVTISPNAFANMKRMRMLILNDVHISSQGPVRLPNELSWLKWPNAPDLEFGSGPKKLVRLDVQKSHIRQLGGNFRNFRTLKSINFSECNFLASVPDLSSAPNLERLDLDGCESLVEVHQSVGYHDKLKYLSLQLCFNLSIFPSTLKTKSLQKLCLSCCSKLEKFPDILVKMEHLEYLELQETAIKELPASIENLVSVKRIDLGDCKNLARLPSSIYKLKNLKFLSLEWCSNFVMFPKNLKDSTDLDGDMGFQNLYELRLTGCNLSEVEFLERSSNFPLLEYLLLANNKFTHLPTCINKYDYWKDLFVDKCKQSKGVNVADVSALSKLLKRTEVHILLNGREMPEWILHCKGDSLSFMVPQDLYDKFLGLTLCFVLGPEQGKVVHHASYVVDILVNHDRRVSSCSYRKYFYPLESDHVWLLYFPRNTLIEGQDYLRKDLNHFQVELRASKGSVKKCGFRLICKQQEDDLRVVLQHHQPIERNWVFEQGDSEEDILIDTEEEDSPVKQNLTKKMRLVLNHGESMACKTCLSNWSRHLSKKKEKNWSRLC
ncbi:disease resistance protein RUN1-like [Syzygium oleosum]|uniref:disease resistance protein RUN1-like n=1 Tax=Syzygium oleosum TaxID=219896 RepID=UPI0024BBAD52|nr:disease resistance protein RUN1-like [Syzygium oleosum]